MKDKNKTVTKWFKQKDEKSKHKITQRTTNSIFLHKYFWKSPFVELLNRLNAKRMWKRTHTQHKESEPIEHKNRNKTKTNTQ